MKREHFRVLFGASWKKPTTRLYGRVAIIHGKPWAWVQVPVARRVGSQARVYLCCRALFVARVWISLLLC